MKRPAQQSVTTNRLRASVRNSLIIGVGLLVAACQSQSQSSSSSSMPSPSSPSSASSVRPPASVELGSIRPSTTCASVSAEQLQQQPVDAVIVAIFFFTLFSVVFAAALDAFFIV